MYMHIYMNMYTHTCNLPLNTPIKSVKQDTYD